MCDLGISSKPCVMLSNKMTQSISNYLNRWSGSFLSKRLIDSLSSSRSKSMQTFSNIWRNECLIFFCL